VSFRGDGRNNNNNNHDMMALDEQNGKTRERQQIAKPPKAK